MQRCISVLLRKTQVSDYYDCKSRTQIKMYIKSDAEVLLSRDRGVYKLYFPELKVIEQV